MVGYNGGSSPVIKILSEESAEYPEKMGRDFRTKYFFFPEPGILTLGKNFNSGTIY